MKKIGILVGFWSVLFILEGASATINYNASNPNSPDGVWYINHDIPAAVQVDYFSSTNPREIPNPGTVVVLKESGSILYQLDTYNYSRTEIYGLVSPECQWWWLSSYDRSTVNIYGGYAVMTERNWGGGYRDMFAYNNSKITIYANFNSNYYGDFKYSPTAVYGYDDFGLPRWYGYISGTYENGDAFEIWCRSYDNAQIILAPVPEPATLSLLALGLLALRRKS